MFNALSVVLPVAGAVHFFLGLHSIVLDDSTCLQKVVYQKCGILLDIILIALNLRHDESSSCVYSLSSK